MIKGQNEVIYSCYIDLYIYILITDPGYLILTIFLKVVQCQIFTGDRVIRDKYYILFNISIDNFGSGNNLFFT